MKKPTKRKPARAKLPATKRTGATPKDKYVLRLFVAGATIRSRQAVLRVREMSETILKGRVKLEVIDIYQQPGLARRNQIVATPTLIIALAATVAPVHRQPGKYRRPFQPARFGEKGPAAAVESTKNLNHPTPMTMAAYSDVETEGLSPDQAIEWGGTRPPDAFVRGRPPQLVPEAEFHPSVRDNGDWSDHSTGGKHLPVERVDPNALGLGTTQTSTCFQTQPTFISCHSERSEV